MFTSIAPKYDVMNDIMTGFSHRITRKFALNLLKLKNNERLLDLASGTGDFALLANSLKTENEIIAVDLRRKSLHAAGLERKDQLIPYFLQVALNLEQFDTGINTNRKNNGFISATYHLTLPSPQLQ